MAKTLTAEQRAKLEQCVDLCMKLDELQEQLANEGVRGWDSEEMWRATEDWQFRFEQVLGNG